MAAILKRATKDAGCINGRAISRSIDGGPTEALSLKWIVRAPHRLPVVFFGLALGGMVIWGIEKEAAQIDFQLLVSALRATSSVRLAAALATTALSYLALVGYDISGLRYARAHAPLRTILLASFCGFAIGNSLAWVPSPVGPCAIGCIRLRGSRRAKLRA